MLPGRKSGFRGGFRPDSNRENLKIGPPAGRKADSEDVPVDIQLERPISGPKALLCKIGYHCGRRLFFQPQRANNKYVIP